VRTSMGQKIRCPRKGCGRILHVKGKSYLFVRCLCGYGAQAPNTSEGRVMIASLSRRKANERV